MRSGSLTHERAAKRTSDPDPPGGSTTLTLGQSNCRSTSSSNEIPSSFSARSTARTKRESANSARATLAPNTVV